MTGVTFVDDCLVELAVAEARPPPDEYETDSGDLICQGGRRYCAHSFNMRAANTRPFPAGYLRYAYSRYLS